MQNFKDFLNNKARNDFREEQFFAHSFSRALTESEWMHPEELTEDLKVFKSGGKIEHRSNHPFYDKEQAFRHYGTPSEDKESTNKNIEKYKTEHGKQPAKSIVNTHLKVFVHDTNPKTAGGVTGIIRNHGLPDKEPPTDEERKAEAERNFDSFSSLKKSNPTAYAKKVKEAKARYKDAKASEPLRDTTKGDTITNLKGDNDSEKNGHVSLGFSGSPDVRKHTVNADGDYVQTNACHGKGNCVHDCLAKGGCGKFASTKGHRGSYDQMDSHNASSRHDVDLMMHHQLHGIAAKAKKEGKGAIVRPDTTTGHQAFTHSDAIKKHFGADSENYKSGKGQKIKVNTYGKTYGSKYDTHDMRGNDTNITLSDQGIPTHKKAIEAHEALTKAMRERGTPGEGKHGSRIAFTVLQTRHPQTPGGMSDEDYVKYAKHANRADQEDYEKAKGVERVRRYDLKHSEPEHGESSEYHDEKNRVGRVTHEGKSYKYSDHDVPRAMDTVDGKSSPTYMHDNHGGELSRHHRENPNGHGINAIAMATSSTNIKHTEVGKSIFHPIRNIDKNHVLHVMHPASPEAEHARKVMSEK